VSNSPIVDDLSYDGMMDPEATGGSLYLPPFAQNEAADGGADFLRDHRCPVAAKETSLRPWAKAHILSMNRSCLRQGGSARSCDRLVLGYTRAIRHGMLWSHARACGSENLCSKPAPVVQLPISVVLSAPWSLLLGSASNSPLLFSR